MKYKIWTVLSALYNGRSLIYFKVYFNIMVLYANMYKIGMNM